MEKEYGCQLSQGMYTFYSISHALKFEMHLNKLIYGLHE